MVHFFKKCEFSGFFFFNISGFTGFKKNVGMTKQ